MRRQAQLLKVISDAEVDRIHTTSLAILEEIGVQFPNAGILSLFADAGAAVDFDRQVVRIPAGLVERALASLPRDFSITPADGGPPIQLGDGDLKLSMDCSDQIVDLSQRRKQRGTQEDVLKGIDEALSYLKRMLASFEVNDDTLALDSIRDAGIGGDFLAQPHTVAHMRHELWQPGSIFPRLDYEIWSAGGAKTALDRAKERLNEILQAFPPAPVLEPDKAQYLQEIRERAEAEAASL